MQYAYITHCIQIYMSDARFLPVIFNKCCCNFADYLVVKMTDVCKKSCSSLLIIDYRKTGNVG